MTADGFVAAYRAALATQQWQNVAPLIDKNATVVFSNGEILHGVEAIKAAYERNFTLIKNEEYVMSNLQWILKNETIAEYKFDFSWKGTIDGQPASGSGKGSATIIANDGKWKLLKEELYKAQ